MATQKEHALELSKAMNVAFGKCLGIVAPPIQFPQENSPNPTQKETYQLKSIEAAIAEFAHVAKHLEMFFLNKLTQQGNTIESPLVIKDEISALEHELKEKNELIAKYSDLMTTLAEPLRTGTMPSPPAPAATEQLQQ